jgi:type 1 fimbriae regulatory protein FimB
MKALTHDELLKVLRLAASNVRDHAIVLLAFRHGMRVSEICNLEMKDVDLANGQITVKRLKGSLATTQPMSDVQGSPLLSEKRVLRAWLKERGSHPSKYVFVSQKSGHISRMQLHRIFSELAEQAGVSKDRRHFHTLKHSLGVSPARRFIPCPVTNLLVRQSSPLSRACSNPDHVPTIHQTRGDCFGSLYARLPPDSPNVPSERRDDIYVL